MFWLELVVKVARPVDMVCCVHLEVPKSPICNTVGSGNGAKRARCERITHEGCRQETLHIFLGLNLKGGC